jgi:hypothetical protein
LVIVKIAGEGMADSENVTMDVAYKLFAKCNPRAISNPFDLNESHPNSNPMPI